MGDTKRSRGNCPKLTEPPSNSLQQFPVNEIFDWERELNDKNNIKLLYRFTELEEFSKGHPTEQCIGYLSVIVVEMNLVTLYRQNMFLCGICCGLPVYCNNFETACSKCGEQLQNLLPNPGIIGLLADETGCILGEHILFSEQAWNSFFGRTVKEIVEEASVKPLRHFEQITLFDRFTMMFGFDPEIGKVAVWGIERYIEPGQDQ